MVGSLDAASTGMFPALYRYIPPPKTNSAKTIARMTNRCFIFSSCFLNPAKSHFISQLWVRAPQAGNKHVFERRGNCLRAGDGDIVRLQLRPRLRDPVCGIFADRVQG